MTEMTKGERGELRQAVKLQFKVLRGEVLQRKAEILSALESELAAQDTADQQKEHDVEDEIREVIATANKAVHNVLYKHELRHKDGAEESLVSLRWSLKFAERDNMNRRQEASRAIDARVREAISRLDRQEADILRRLTLDALETDAARAFFDGIPTVSELVPMARLAELEQSFGGDR
jgi:hypothetical protein